MGKTTVHTETMRRAAAALGGEAGLARALRIPAEQARRWLKGDDYPPTEVYLRALDLLIATGAH
jgi:hypothetical protein